MRDRKGIQAAPCICWSRCERLCDSQAHNAAGLVFTAGMVITDTLDGRLICRVSHSAHGQAAGQRYRRVLGWLIVAISYGVATYNIGKALVPTIELDELAFSLTGAALIALMAALWACLSHKRSRRDQPMHGAA